MLILPSVTVEIPLLLSNRSTTTASQPGSLNPFQPCCWPSHCMLLRKFCFQTTYTHFAQEATVTALLFSTKICLSHLLRISSHHLTLLHLAHSVSRSVHWACQAPADGFVPEQSSCSGFCEAPVEGNLTLTSHRYFHFSAYESQH